MFFQMTNIDRISILFFNALQSIDTFAIKFIFADVVVLA